jgi:hypothetical protein
MASEGAAFAFGYAASPVLSPAVENLRQAAWELHAVRIPEAAELAAGVARGKVDRDTAAGWAKKHGFDGGVFDTLVTIAELAPDVGTGMRAWRRGKLTTAQFETVLKRSGLADEWVEAVEALKSELLDPGQLAAAIHRGLIPDPGLLKGEQPTPPFNVEPYPVYEIDALAEAAGSGFDHDRLGVLVGLQGLPMGVIEAAQAYFRGDITHGDYIRAFNESNSRNEWAEAVLAYARQIPTARDFIENALRGYRTFTEAATGAALHGMSEEHARLIFQNSGRPLNLHQITQALAWGAKYNPQPGDDPDPYMNSVLIGSVTPAYYEMQDTLKYILPGYFVVKAMLANGTLTVAEASTIFKRSAWPPDLADKAAQALAPKATGATENPYVAKADTQLWTAVHKAYVKMGAPRAEVEPILTHLISDATVRGAVFTDWDLERQAQSLQAPAA